MTAPAPAKPEVKAGLHVETVWVKGFRALEDVCLTLEPGTTVFVGENNSGKSALLAALQTALWGRRADPDDLHLDGAGKRVTEFTIDLTIVPTEADRFEPTVGTLYGNAIRRDEADREMVALRTVGSLGVDRSEVDVRRAFLEGWNGCGENVASEIPGVLVADRHRNLVSFTLLEANRDLVAQLRQRNSAWGRMVAQLNLPPNVIEQIETVLGGAGDRVIAESEVLTRLRDQLLEVQRVLATVAVVKLEPIPLRVDELARAIDVTVGAPGSAALPLRLEGLGSRSLAELMVFRAFAATLPGVGEAVEPHNLSCFEEPEAHLHPQAQVAVAGLIEGIPGQKVVTTHSPTLASEASLTSVRLLRRAGAGVDVRVATGLDQEDVIKVRRLVERPYGQVLFARLVLIPEGATERASLPVFARAFWAGVELEGKGVSVVDPESLSQAAGLAKLLDDLGIPWLVLADGDPGATAALATISQRIGRPLNETSPEVVMLPASFGFERYLLSEGLRPQIEAGIAALYGNAALNDFRAQGNNAQLAADELVREFLQHKKGTYGAAIAQAIVATRDADDRPTIPGKVRELFERADAILNPEAP